MDAVVDCVLGCLPAPAVDRAASLSADDAASDDDGEDRISALPDEILCSVVSRLPVKDAFLTTALSTRWRRVWHSAPLVLCDAHLLPSRDPERVAAVARVLADHPGPFHAVHLAYCFFELHKRELARWSRLLAASSVQDLVFINQPPPIDLRLPADILLCASLRRLYLGFWRFPDTDGAGVFPHLRELGILNTVLSDRDLEHMLASSPVLETLALVVSYGMPENVRLRGQSLRCMLFWLSVAVELAVVDAPCLDRLLMWQTSPPCEGDESESDDEPLMKVKIACAPELRVLGYLEPRVHELHIGNTVIKADTKASPSSVVPSVRILALKVNLGVFSDVKMVASVLRCFPNVETLHVESAVAGESTGKHHVKFFEELSKFFEDLSPVECVRLHIKEAVLHEFRGDRSEIAFLKFFSQRAQELQKLTLVVSDEKLASVDRMKGLLSALAYPPWASEGCTVLLVGPKLEHVWNFHRASDLSVDDPFLSIHGAELFHFIKRENEEFTNTNPVWMNTP